MAAETLRDVERDTFVQRPPEVVAVPMTLDGLTSTRRSLALLAEQAGFELVITGAIGYDLPRWQKLEPTDDVTHYFGRLVSTVRIIGHRQLAHDQHGLLGFEALWRTNGDGRSAGAPDARLKMKGWPWRRVGVTQLTAVLKVTAGA